MLINFMTCEIVNDGMRYAQSYCFRSFTEKEKKDDSLVRIQDINLVEKCIYALTDDKYIKRREPPKEAKPLFNVYINITNTHKHCATYQVDYHKYKDCPLSVVDTQMELYKYFKKRVRIARDTLKVRDKVKGKGVN